MILPTKVAERTSLTVVKKDIWQKVWFTGVRIIWRCRNDTFFPAPVMFCQSVPKAMN